MPHFVFDGDNVCHGRCSDLGFDETDRSGNIRRIAEMVKLFLQAGVIALTAFTSPFQADRQKVRGLIGEQNFIEIYCYCPVEVCEQRDLKGPTGRHLPGKSKTIQVLHLNMNSPNMLI